MACCINSIAISRPNNSPATRVNLLIKEHAPRMASKKSKRAVQTHTLKTQSIIESNINIDQSLGIIKVPRMFMRYHAVQAKKSFCPKSFRSFAKLNMNVYINTVGSATPRIRRGCPPTTEWITPQSAVDARVCTAVKVPSVT